MQELSLQALRWCLRLTDTDNPSCIDHALGLGLKPEYLQCWSQSRRALEETPEALLLAMGLRLYEVKGQLATPIVLRTWVDDEFRSGRLPEPQLQSMRGVLDAAAHFNAHFADVEPVVTRLRDDYLRHVSAHGIVSIAEDIGRRPVPEISNHLRALADQLDTSHAVGNQGVYTLADIAQSRRRRYADVAQDHALGRGYMTGWLEFDKRNNGLPPGQVMVIAANSSVGKSTFQLRTALNLWLNGHPVMLVNKEMTNRSQHGRLEAMFLSRLLADDPGLQNLVMRITVGELSEKEQELYFAMLDEFTQYDVPFWMVSPDAYTDLDDLASMVASYKRQHGLQVLCADSLNLHRVRHGASGQRDDLRIGDNTRMLADLAKVHDIAVITDCQSPQTVAHKRVCGREEAVGYSQRIIHDTDILIRLFPTDEYELEAQVLKARDGDVNYNFSLYFDRANMRMEYAGATAC